MIYRVVVDGQNFYDETLDRVLISPSVELELNSAGSCDFTIPPNHDLYSLISLMSSDIEVYEDEDLIFFGRPVEIKTDFYNQKQVHCEGALAYLNDSIIRPAVWENVSIKEIFRKIIQSHNSQVASNRQFTIGDIGVADKLVYREFNYETCKEALMKFCIDTTGGYLVTRKENDVNYIDWIKSLESNLADQPVQYALNITDISQQLNGADIKTGIIPLGPADENGVKMNIQSVNAGSDRLLSEAASTYGNILQVVDFNDVNDATELKQRGLDWLADEQFEGLTVEVDAAELSYLDDRYHHFAVGQKVHCVSDPHILDKNLPITKISVSLDSAVKTITVGTQKKQKFTEIYKNGSSTGYSSYNSSGGSARGTTADVEYAEIGGSIGTENSGTSVVANPEGEATEELNTIQIGEDIYEIVGGSSSSGGKQVVDLLYENQSTTASTITTSKPMTDYDYIVIEADEYTAQYINTCMLLKAEIEEAIATGRKVTPIYLNDRYAIYCTISDSTTIEYATAANTYIRKIYGVKGGSGSGGSGLEIITEHFEGGTGTTSRTFTLPDNREPSWVRIKGYTDGNWHADMQFRWGDTIAYAITDDRHPYNSSYTYNNNVTYANNTFTLVGYNAGTVFNTSSSNFDVDYIYNEGGGSGTDVEANPSEEPTEELNTIRIGDTVYEIAGGGSGSGAYSRTVLYDTGVALPAQATLTDDITNYDILEIVITYEQINKGKTSYFYDAKKFVQDFPYVANPDSYNTPHFVISDYYPQYSRFIMGDATNKLWCYQSNYGYLVEVAGLKFNGGSGSGGTNTEVIPIEAGDGASTRTFTFEKQPKLIHIWFTVPDKWSMTEDVFWGQPWGVYSCTNGNAPYSNGAFGSNTFVFDDTNLTMTITGINALGCANNTNGYGYMWLDYGEGGGGTEVEANPAEEPTDTLTTIKIGDTVYDIDGAGGSGSSYSETDLWTGSGNMYNSLSLEISDDYTNYDALRFEYQSVRADAQNIPVHYEKCVSKETLETSDRFSISDFYLWNNVGVNVSGSFTDATHLTTYLEAYSWFSSCTLTRIVGIKYGSGGSDNSASTAITSLYNNDSGLTTVGEITLSGSILDYDDLEFIVGINTNIDHSHQSYRISTKYFYDYFKYGTQHSDDHFMVSPWYDMACGFTLGQNNDPTKINFYDMYTGNSGVNTALYSINGIKYGSGSSSSQEEYSITEKVIGKWVDGKPLYQKTVYSASLGTGMKVPIAHGISNLGVVVGVDAVCFDSGAENAWFPLSHISTDGYNIGVFSVDGTNINFSNPTAFGSRITEIYATLKYTKTTD